MTERQPWTDQEPSEAEYQAMAAIIIAQPELNGMIRYSSLRAGIAAYLLDEAEQEDQ